MVTVYGRVPLVRVVLAVMAWSAAPILASTPASGRRDTRVPDEPAHRDDVGVALDDIGGDGRAGANWRMQKR